MRLSQTGLAETSGEDFYRQLVFLTVPGLHRFCVAFL